MIRLRDMWVGNQSTATINSLVTVEAQANDVAILNNGIETNNLTVLSVWVQLASGAFDVIERDTAWGMNFAHIAPPTNAIADFGGSRLNKMQSHILGTPTLS